VPSGVHFAANVEPWRFILVMFMIFFCMFSLFICHRPSAYPLSHGVAWYSTGEGIVAHVTRVIGIHQCCHSGLSSVLDAVKRACLDDTNHNLAVILLLFLYL
jgi:hypothetical protein